MGTPPPSNQDLGGESPEAIRQQLEKILGSRTFIRAPLKIRFLRFIVEETLEGRGDQLREIVIGVEALQIKDFDPKADNNVR